MKVWIKSIMTPVILFTGLALVQQARAGCADPRTPGAYSGMPSHFVQVSNENRSASDPSGHSIVGTWHVTYTTAEGAPAGEAFIQWHDDGTEWENINFPILGGNICMGSWKAVGTNRFFRNHYGWLYMSGLLSGYFNETETDTLSPDGNSYTGTNEMQVYDLSGNPVGDVATGRVSATRILPRKSP